MMNELPINITDIVLVVILLISGILAFSRGIVHEILSIIGWLGAGLITLEAYPYSSPVARKYIDEPIIADIVGSIIIFISSLVTLWLLATSISRRVRESEIGALDRSLGFLFGIIRGAFFVCLAYLILIQFLPVAEHPSWIAQTRAVPVIQYGSQILSRIIPSSLRDQISTIEKTGSETQKKVGNAIEAGRAIQKLQNIETPTKEHDNPGYTTEQRMELERIIRGTADN